MYQRPQFKLICQRMDEKRRFLQILAGPRQVGKTTLAQQVQKAWKKASVFVSADEPTIKSISWLEQQWETARFTLKKSPSGVLLILDEIQKIPHWADKVKFLWDQDTREKNSIHILLLGSSPLLMQKGLDESLAGRFELIPVTHWSYPEMQTAFTYSLDEYIYFGGYPGAAAIRKDADRWSNYILDSLIETSLSRDILLMTRVDKPALLRRLFHIGCEYSGQIVAYQKMLGQLQDAGNTTTLAHYLALLGSAGMLTGLPKYAGEKIRQRASSPKLQVMNTALQSALLGLSFSQVRQNHETWGRLAESAVGAHLVNASLGTGIKVCYWRDSNREVDFVLQKGKNLLALEVKTAEKKESLPGLDAFQAKFKSVKKMLIGGQGIPLNDFFSADVKTLF